MSNTPFRRFKTFVHEGGIATPLIVHWPAGIRARGQLRRQVVHVMDFLPTFIELVGAKYPTQYQGHSITPLDGRSIVPTFDDQPLAPRPLFWEHCGNRAVRDGRWKLVAVNDGVWELYDLECDRTETRNVAAEHPEIVARLTQLYDEWAQSSNVLPWDKLEIPFIPPEDNPLTRTPAELEKYLDELEARGIDPPFARRWREEHAK